LNNFLRLIEDLYKLDEFCRMLDLPVIASEVVEILTGVHNVIETVENKEVADNEVAEIFAELVKVIINGLAESTGIEKCKIIDTIKCKLERW